MEISAEVEEKIKKALEQHSGKMPRLVFKKGGCAGNMLVLLLEEPYTSDKIVEHNGMKFAIEKNAIPFADNVSIELKSGLCEEIVVRNNNAQTCKCGKSFKIQQNLVALEAKDTKI